MGAYGVSKVLAVLAVVVPLTMTTAASSAELTAIPVKTPDQGSATQASADGDWFGWMHTTERNSRRGRTFSYVVQRGDEPRIIVNAKDTKAVDGGIYRHTVVYEQWRDEHSDLYRYDLRTGRRSKFPGRVNTVRGSESDPTLSGRYLLFTRHTYVKDDEEDVYKVLLYDRRTQTLRKLDVEKAWIYGSARYLAAGQVNGPWVVWTDGNYSKDGGSYFTVFRYNIRRDVTTKVVPPFEYEGYGPSPQPAISNDGTVYFVGDKGDSVNILKKRLDAPAEVIYSGATAGELFVDDHAEARHVYFTVYEEGIYKLVDPVP